MNKNRKHAGISRSPSFGGGFFLFQKLKSVGNVEYPPWPWRCRVHET